MGGGRGGGGEVPLPRRGAAGQGRSRRAGPALRRPCWWWTRRTASPLGATTSAPTTCGSARGRADGATTVVALTATAAPPVRAEIVQRLGLRRPAGGRRQFDRPNLELGCSGSPTTTARDRPCWSQVRTAAAGHRVRRHPPRRRGVRGGARGSGGCAPRRTTLAFGAADASESHEGSSRTGSMSWSRPSRSGWASTSRTSASWSTPTSPARWTRTTRRSGAPAATASRRWPCCSTARRTSACGASSPPGRRTGRPCARSREPSAAPAGRSTRTRLAAAPACREGRSPRR